MNHWYTDGVVITSVIAIAVSVITALRAARLQRELDRLGRTVGSTYECDSQFLEIQKVFIAEPRLYPFYGIGDMKAYWEGLDEDGKRLYIFTELHYFHLAFAHREHKVGRVDDAYWAIYENWLNTLVRHSDMFRIIHSREARNFESSFADLVTKKIQVLKQAPKASADGHPSDAEQAEANG